MGQTTPPAAEEARLRSGHSLERNFLRKDRVAQPKKRKGGGNPIERRPNEDRHEDKSDEILQYFAAAGHLELAVMPGDGLGDGRRVREDDAARSTRDVLPAAEAEDTDIANRSESAALVFHPHRLGRVLHHEDPAAPTERADPLDVGRDTEQVVREHAERVGVERLLEEGVVKVEGLRADVAERGS